MKIKELNFFDDYQITVQFELDGDEYIGSLAMGRSKIPMLQINTNNPAILFDERRCISSQIICQEIGTGKHFILHDSSLWRGIIYPEFVILGAEHHEIYDVIEVSLTGISEQCEGGRSYELSQDEFKRDLRVDKFSIDFSFNENKYLINNTRNVSVEQIGLSEQSIKIQDGFVIKKINSDFSLKEIKDLSQEIRNLFSLVFGGALSIRSIYLSSSLKKNFHSCLIFPCITYKSNPMGSVRQAICDFSNIFRWQLWDTIFNNYFSKKSFRKIWCRIVPSLSDKLIGYWEHNILSVVVTLEMYCELISKGHGHKLNTVQFKALKEQLAEVLTNFEKTEELSGDDISLINDLAGAIKQLKNTSHATLQNKYDFLMERTSLQIRDVIGFSEADFTIIKKLRNSVAHGTMYKTVEEGEITKELEIKDKLLVLLMYFVFNELGFSDMQIAQLFDRTRNEIIMRAGLNEKARDRITGNAKFITLAGMANIDGLKYYQPIVIIYNQDGDEYHLDDRLTHKTQNEWHNSGFSDIRDFVKSLISKNQYSKLEYLNKIYLVLQGKEHLFMGAILLTK
jgi:hypothetical protein